MTVYDDAKQIAKDVLGDPDLRQDTIKLIQITRGSGPADEPGATTETAYDLDATAGQAPYRFIKDGFTRTNAYLISAAIIDDVEVTTDDFIEINGVRYKIVQDLTSPSPGARTVWKFFVQK